MKRSGEERERAALAELEKDCEEYPGSPMAVRRPVLTIRGGCIALLGSRLQDVIAGIGGTVRAALRASDVQYLNSLRPPRA